MRSLTKLVEAGLRDHGKRPASFTYDPDLRRYTFRIDGAESGPYRERREDVLLEYDRRGKLAGVVLLDKPEPSVGPRDPLQSRPRLFNWRTGYVPRNKR